MHCVGAFEFDLVLQKTISNITLHELIPDHPLWMARRWECVFRCARSLQFDACPQSIRFV